MIGLLAGLCSFSSAFAADDIPIGKLNVDRTLVRTGARSQLDWQIQYASVVTSVVDIVPPNTIKALYDLKMRVRVLGATFQQTKSNNGHGNNLDGVDSSNPGQGAGGPNGAIDASGLVDDESKALYLPVEVVWSLNSASWARIFYGTQTTLDPTSLVIDTTIRKGDTVNFGGRGYLNKWLGLYHTAAASPNVVMLKKGDKLPTTIPAFQLGLIQNFLKPYLAADLKTVNIGNLDYILLLELGETNTSRVGFNVQDLGVLVTFE